jgi:hypothetical protein
MSYPKRLLIAIDQFFAVLLFGTLPDETISAMAHRRQWKRTEAVINWLFGDPRHCADAYASEKDGAQNAEEYRNG